jgi:hypothetical protein
VRALLLNNILWSRLQVSTHFSEIALRHTLAPLPPALLLHTCTHGISSLSLPLLSRRRYLSHPVLTFLHSPTHCSSHPKIETSRHTTLPVRCLSPQSYWHTCGERTLGGGNCYCDTHRRHTRHIARFLRVSRRDVQVRVVGHCATSITLWPGYYGSPPCSTALVLHYIVLHCTAATLHCTGTTLHCTALHCDDSRLRLDSAVFARLVEPSTLVSTPVISEVAVALAHTPTSPHSYRAHTSITATLSLPTHTHTHTHTPYSHSHPHSHSHSHPRSYT